MASDSDRQQQLIAICHKLKQEGLPLSVALLRARAPFSVSVAEAINLLRHYKQTGEPPLPVKTKSETELSRIEQLEQRIRHLEEKMQAMESRLTRL